MLEGRLTRGVECDKAFTRSDALAKHMRTVHEPEPARAPNGTAPQGSKKAPIKLKLTNGNSTPGPPGHTHTPSTGSATNQPAINASAPESRPPPPDRDEDGNPVAPSPYNDNISYTPAHHPITGQPGYMITYPPDVQFSSWESAINCDQLLRLLRRQLHWAQKEGDELRAECKDLEKIRRQEWELKEILLEGVFESELSRAEKEGLLDLVDERTRAAMETDVQPAKTLEWSGGGVPAFRTPAPLRLQQEDIDMANAVSTPQEAPVRTPSPPPTGNSGGFDGDADPYDNYLASRMAEYEERERLRSLHNTPVNVKKEAPIQQGEKEQDAVGALVEMSAAPS